MVDQQQANRKKHFENTNHKDMSRESNNDKEKHLLSKMDEYQEVESYYERIKTEPSPYSFAFFDLNQNDDLSNQYEYNERNIPDEPKVPKEFVEGSFSQPIFFTPPKVIDMEINQVQKKITSEESNELKEWSEKEITDENEHPLDSIKDAMLEESTINLPISERTDKESSLHEDFSIINENDIHPVLSEAHSTKGMEPESIREEIFMMLDEELGENREEAFSMQRSPDTSNANKENNPSEQKPTGFKDLDHPQQKGNLTKQADDNPDQEFLSQHENQKDRLFSVIDPEFDSNHPSPFVHFLESMYCENDRILIENESTDFVHSIGNLTAVLKEISNEKERTYNVQDYNENDENTHTSLKKHFENELSSEEQDPEAFVEMKSTNVHLITVKVPVILSNLIINVTVDENIELPFPIKEIQSITWTIHSLKTHIPLQTSTVFIKGILVATIEYLNSGEKGSIYSVKIPIEWNQTSSISWLNQPNLPGTDQIEYSFSRGSHQDITTHHESYHSFCDPIQESLQNFKCVSQQEISKQREKTILNIKGCFMLCLHLTQEQLVQVNKW